RSRVRKRLNQARKRRSQEGTVRAQKANAQHAVNYASHSAPTNHSSGCHARHCEASNGAMSGASTLKRTTPSDVAQKFLVPAAAATGVATATNSWHKSFGHTG